MTESEKKLYDITKATSSLDDSLMGLEGTMNKLAKSKGLGVISRLASGVLPNFWAIQNKIRAGFTIIDEYYDKQRKSTKEAMEAMEALVEVGEMATAMQPFDNLFNMDLTDLMKVNDMDFLLAENLKGYEQIEFSIFGKKGIQNTEDMIELLETVRDLIQPQRDIIEERLLDVKKARHKDKFVKERFETHMAGFGKGFTPNKKGALKEAIKLGNINAAILALQTGFVAFYIRSKLKAKDIIFKAARVLKMFIIWIPIIILVLFTLKKTFDMLKEPLVATKELISQMLVVFGAAFALTLEHLGEAFETLIQGFKDGDFFAVLSGVIQIAFWSFAALATVLFGAVSILIGSIIITLMAILAQAGESASAAANTVGTLLLIAGTIGLVVAAIYATPAMIGVAIYSLMATVLGGIMTLTGFSTGGVVNSNMQLVGERGPELVTLPRGSRVHSNADSKRMGGSGGNTINVHVNGRVGASDAEIRDIANKVAREINLRMSRTGSGVNNF